MAAGLSDIIKSLSLKELQEAARHYVDHQEKLPVLENFEKNCLEALEETAVELSDEDHQKLVILHSFYANYDHYAEYYNHYGDDANDTDDANNAKIQAKLARLIPIQPQVNSSSERAASNSTWQRAVVTATTLREIIFDSIAAEANKKQLDKENLIKILPRILTPNQTCSSELDDIKNDYAGRIPYDLLKLLNVLRHEVVLMANNMGIEFDEKIAGITILYESFVKSMKVKAEKMLDDVMNDTFFEELHKIMKLSKADKEFLTDDKIGALLTNSYMLMCCQYINPVMQDEVQKQHHQDTGIIVSCISRIYQYIQSGKKGQELVSSITETAQEELATNNEMIRRDTYAKAVQSLKDGLVKFYSLIQDEKYEAVQQVLSSISIPSRKDENYYLQIVGKLEVLSNKKSRKLSGLFTKDYAADAAAIVQQDKNLQQTISELTELAKTIRELKTQSSSQPQQINGSYRRSSAPSSGSHSSYRAENSFTAQSAPEKQSDIFLASTRYRFYTSSKEGSCSSTSSVSRGSLNTEAYAESGGSNNANSPRKES